MSVNEEKMNERELMLFFARESSASDLLGKMIKHRVPTVVLTHQGRLVC
jgi:hypothetical protein